MALIMVIAACTKSAQIPFSAWLPAAIAAPTPVSALVHSSTLVTAGVYLLIRFNVPILEWGVNKPLFIIAILTILMAGVGANLETDLKKIIALSTLRQLGLIIISIGIGATTLAYFHILTHALFKALLFMCAGNIIHCRGDNQDLRKIGFVCMQIPITCVCINTANLALCGAPFIAGFYSKDLIIEAMLTSANSFLPAALAIFATALTVTYSLRLRYFRLITNANCRTVFRLRDPSQYACRAIIPLTALSMAGGVTLSWLVFPSPQLFIMGEITKTIIIPTLIAGILLRICIMYASNRLAQHPGYKLITHIAGSMWFLPTLVTRGYGLITIQTGFNATYTIDRG